MFNVQRIYNIMHGLLSDIVIPIKALYCKDSNCTDHNIEIYLLL